MTILYHVSTLKLCFKKPKARCFRKVSWMNGKRINTIKKIIHFPRFYRELSLSESVIPILFEE